MRDRPSLSDIEKDEIRELRRAGVSARDVSEKYGCSHTTVLRIERGRKDRRRKKTPSEVR